MGKCLYSISASGRCLAAMAPALGAGYRRFESSRPEKKEAHSKGCGLFSFLGLSEDENRAVVKRETLSVCSEAARKGDFPLEPWRASPLDPLIKELRGGPQVAYGDTARASPLAPCIMKAMYVKIFIFSQNVCQNFHFLNYDIHLF